jgi:transglutaminase-like putative cysteine protease
VLLARGAIVLENRLWRVTLNFVRSANAILAAVLMGCLAAGAQDVSDQAAQLADRGDFKGAAALLDNAARLTDLSPASRKQLEFQRDVLNRIKKDYSLTKEDLFQKLTASVNNLTPEEFEHWIAAALFDGRIIDGQMFYVKPSVSNLFFRHPELNARRLNGPDKTAEQQRRLEVCREIKTAAREQRVPYVLPHHFACTMTVTTEPHAAPPGQTIRAWLPIPRQLPFQDGFELSRADPPPKSIAPQDSVIRSAYLEQRASADGSAKFQIAYTYTARGVYFDLQPEKIRRPDATASDLAPFVKQEPHVIFTDQITNLAGQLVGHETNPMLQAKAFYDWIGGNVQYSFAREYSTLTNLSDYCLSHRYGDCGQEALLFITLCRWEGIPARWQTGWDIFPGGKDIHDWTEIYLEPYGWVPVDPWAGLYATQYSTALTPAQRQELHDFYFGGLDYYRMAANSGHSKQLEPPKNTLRSDDVDFQRGELEWDGGNIYFDKYSYDLAVEELK